MAAPKHILSEQEFNSAPYSFESILSPYNHAPMMTRPPGQIKRADRDWYHKQTYHFHRLSKKMWHQYRHQQEINITLYNQFKKQ